MIYKFFHRPIEIRSASSKIGLTRTVGERNGTNDPYVILAKANSKVPAVRIRPMESLNMVECTAVGDGAAFFSRDARGIH